MNTMSTTPEDDAAERWLAVLAGREAPTDRDTSQAAEARGFFNAQIDALASRPADPQRMKSLMNLMEAEGQKIAQEAAAASAAPGFWGGLKNWLLPAEPSASAWRLGGVTAGVLGVAVLVRGLMGTPDEDPSQMKSPPAAATPAPAATTPAPSAPTVAAPPATLVLGTADPVRSAVELQEVLKRAGVEARVTGMGASAQVEASVSPAQADAVKAELGRLGLSWPGGSTLVVTFEAR